MVSYISPHSGGGISTRPDQINCPDVRHTNYLDSKLWSVVGTGRDVLNLTQGQHAVDDPPKDDMLPVQKVAFGRSDEELAPVGVRTGVGLSMENQNKRARKVTQKAHHTMDNSPGPVCFSLKFSSCVIFR